MILFFSRRMSSGDRSSLALPERSEWSEGWRDMLSEVGWRGDREAEDVGEGSWEAIVCFLLAATSVEEVWVYARVDSSIQRCEAEDAMGGDGAGTRLRLGSPTGV